MNTSGRGGIKRERKAAKTDEVRASSLSAIAVERRPALANIVADRIRDAIILGELGLGETLSEERLAATLGVSRTPVREALAALQLQGLVVIQPQRGSFVFQPSDEDIAHICEYRNLLEVSAMRLAHQRHARETLGAMSVANTAMIDAETRGDRAQAAQADARFHDAFFDYCDNPLVVQGYTVVSGRAGAIRYSARRSKLARSHASRQHKQIIAAFSGGDLKEAERVLTDHIMNMRAHYADARSDQAA